jgi:hypothetical protein
MDTESGIFFWLSLKKQSLAYLINRLKNYKIFNNSKYLSEIVRLTVRLTSDIVMVSVSDYLPFSFKVDAVTYKYSK